MSVITVEKQSHTNPDKFRISYEVAMRGLGPDAKVPLSDTLPVKRTSSRVAIIGGGFGGIGTSMMLKNKLKEEDFVLFEKHDNLGGTWYANTYPGCASDIPALWYSFSNELNTTWSHVQPPQYEMEEYLLKVVEKYELKKKTRLNSAVTKTTWQEDTGTWEIEVRDVVTGALTLHTSKAVYLCSGGLVHPKQLQAKGLENFKGNYMHSALFDHSVSFKNKNVVVVGNGCSANQIIPVLLKSYYPKKLTQVSRSPQFIMPPIPTSLQYAYRLLSFSRLTLLIVRWIVVLVGESRFPLFKGNGFLSRLTRWVNGRSARAYMKKNCPERYQKYVIPDYKIGCKRLIFDHDYLDSLHDPRANVVGDGIQEIKEHSVVFKNGTEIPADIIVACTGYNLIKSFQSYDIIGRNGVKIQDVWGKQGPSAYRTVLVRDCPNMFYIGGPNSATGHSSVIMGIENSLTYTAKLLPTILSGQYKAITVKTEKYDQWFDEIQAELKKSVFGSAFGGCTSWYAEGGLNFTTYPYSQSHFWWSMNHPRWQDFDLEQGDKKKQ